MLTNCAQLTQRALSQFFQLRRPRPAVGTRVHGPSRRGGSYIHSWYESSRHSTGTYAPCCAAIARSTEDTVDLPEHDMPHTPITCVRIEPPSLPSSRRIAFGRTASRLSGGSARHQSAAPAPFVLRASSEKARSGVEVGRHGSCTTARGSPPLFSSNASSRASHRSSSFSSASALRSARSRLRWCHA